MGGLDVFPGRVVVVADLVGAAAVAVGLEVLGQALEPGPVDADEVRVVGELGADLDDVGGRVGGTVLGLEAEQGRRGRVLAARAEHAEQLLIRVLLLARAGGTVVLVHVAALRRAGAGRVGDRHALIAERRAAGDEGVHQVGLHVGVLEAPVVGGLLGGDLGDVVGARLREGQRDVVALGAVARHVGDAADAAVLAGQLRRSADHGHRVRQVVRGPVGRHHEVEVGVVIAELLVLGGLELGVVERRKFDGLVDQRRAVAGGVGRLRRVAVRRQRDALHRHEEHARGRLVVEAEDRDLERGEHLAGHAFGVEHEVAVADRGDRAWVDLAACHLLEVGARAVVGRDRPGGRGYDRLSGYDGGQREEQDRKVRQHDSHPTNPRSRCPELTQISNVTKR